MSFQPTKLDIDYATIKLNCLVSALLIMLLLILWMQPRDPPTQLDIDNAPFKLNCLLAFISIMLLHTLRMQARNAQVPAWMIFHGEVSPSEGE